LAPLSFPIPNLENEGHSRLFCFLKAICLAQIPFQPANDSQMNFTQLHERLRSELLRRIQRGSLSVSLLARQTGFGQPHLSNFLHSRRLLSMDAVDRILQAQLLTVEDLLPPSRSRDADLAESNSVPLVSHATALFEPYIRPGAVLAILQMPAGQLEQIHARVAHTRRAWQRFVAIRVSATEALPMQPILSAEALVVLDRHYNSLMTYRPNRPNLYAVRSGPRLLLRYADFQSGRLILRPHNLEYPVELLEVEMNESPSEYLVGRVVVVQHEL